MGILQKFEPVGLKDIFLARDSISISPSGSDSSVDGGPDSLVSPDFDPLWVGPISSLPASSSKLAFCIALWN